MTHKEADALGGLIRTYSGRYLSLGAPQQEDIVLVDIAHHLALLTRYTGATPEPYSIAQHSVLVSHLCPPEMALEGLFHDAAEFAMNDLNQPLKRMPELLGYVGLETNVMYPAIAKKFGVSPVIPVEVKSADRLAYRLEIACMWGEELDTPAEKELYLRWRHLVLPQSWKRAEQEFLERHWELMKGRTTDAI